MSYPRLFSPSSIGSMQLKNRIVMSPMTTDYGNIEQEPTERLIAYLEARARGGVGLITLEVCTVALDHRYQPNSLTLSEDRFIPFHQKLLQRLHAHGVKVQPQLTHTGPESLAPFFENKPGLGPSVNVNPGGHQACKPLELEEIPAIIEQYAQGARRVKQAGYDGIELHAAHAYMMLGSFLSPLRNARGDQYGGKKLAGRARLLLETLAAIKDAVGKDFPVTVSLSGYERFPGGRDLNETQALARLLVEAGADAFRISGGTTDGLVSQMIMGSEYPDAANAAAAEAIKQVVDVPVIVVGRIHTPELAEQILSKGQADLVAMARPFLADPDWPNKIQAGNRASMRQCISCQNCIDSMLDYSNMNCAVNAGTGREFQYSTDKSDQPKNVVVIGGGPAGMETARTAHLRGHRVTLLERQRRLGGSLQLASTVHASNQLYLDWIVQQLSQTSIDIRLNCEADIQMLQSLSPDAVIVATGARVATPSISGIEQNHVFTGSQLRRIVECKAESSDFRILPPALRTIAATVLAKLAQHFTPTMLRKLTKVWMPLGKQIAIVGADLAALELAEFLARRGRRVHIFAQAVRIATEIGPKRRNEHMQRLDTLGVTINTEVECHRIEASGMYYRLNNGEQRHIHADNIIVAGEPVENIELLDAVKQQFPEIEVEAIGDCTGLGLIRKATDDALRVASSL